MKTISKILLVAAAFGTMALVSCRKEDNGPKVEEATFEAPALADAAVKVEFNTTTVAQQVVVSEDNTNKTKLVVKDIEFTEGGYAIITKKVVATKAEVGEEIIEIKAYVYNETTGEYEIVGFGKVKVDSKTKSVEVTLTDATGAPAQTQTVTAETVDNTPAQEGSTEANLCRKWIVKRIVVSVKGGQLGKDGVGVKIDADASGVLKLNDVDKLLKDNGVNVPDIVLTDYNIVDVNFTQAGTFFINFSKAAPFTGVYNLSGGTKFMYELKGEGNYIFNAEAEGSIEFQKVDSVDYCFCNVNGKIENGNDVYTSTVELTLAEKK